MRWLGGCPRTFNSSGISSNAQILSFWKVARPSSWIRNLSDGKKHKKSSQFDKTTNELPFFARFSDRLFDALYPKKQGNFGSLYCCDVFLKKSLCSFRMFFFSFANLCLLNFRRSNVDDTIMNCDEEIQSSFGVRNHHRAIGSGFQFLLTNIQLDANLVEGT